MSAIASQIMLAEYRIPSITGYNRLEAVPRSADFDRSLKAEIRDALWMLTRQWQFGEFQGEDAASPVSAMILGEHTPVDRMQTGTGAAVAYDENTPLEVSVEAEKLKPTLSLAIQVARYYIRLMRLNGLNGGYIDLLRARYALNYAIDPNDKDGNQLNMAIQTKLFDGMALLGDFHTPEGGSDKFTNWLATQAIPPNDRATLAGLAGKLSDWYIRNYSQPPGGSANQAWNPSLLDYRVELASPPQGAGAPAQTVLSADQFYGGSLDWYSFDLNTAGSLPLKPEPANPPKVQQNLVSFIPSPVSFKGMPNPRFWMMEDGQTDFGKIDTSPTGLLHLLLAEFGLIYGNDWFMLPYPLAINTICGIRGLVINDVFGDNTLINPAGTGPESDWQRWALFHQTDTTSQTNTNSQAPANQLFYLAPAITQSLDNDPLEVVNFLRDEVADMVWAVETTVPSQSGKGASGNAIALKNTPPVPFIPAGTAAIRYVLGTTVPENWIPFIPVHIQGSDSEIQFQRAAMPGAKGALGEVLREVPAPYYVNEEEVPRSGTLIKRTFRRTRWLNGKTFLWIGRSRESGKGEGWSNLKFDQIVDISPPPAK